MRPVLILMKAVLASGPMFFLFFMKMVERLVVIVGFWYVHATEGLSSHPRSDELDVKFLVLLVGDFPLRPNLSLSHASTHTQQPTPAHYNNGVHYNHHIYS